MVGTVAVCAHVSVFLEIPRWRFIDCSHRIHFPDKFVALSDMTLIENFSLVDTIDLIGYFFSLNLSS